MTQPAKTVTEASTVDPTAVEIAAAVSDVAADEANLPEVVDPVLPEALTLETQAPLVTAGGPQGPQGTGATQYLDDMGNVIGLLQAQDAIEGVESSAEDVLAELDTVAEFEALPDLLGDDDEVPPEEPEIVTSTNSTFSETDFGTLSFGELDSSAVLDDASESSLSLLGVDLDGGLLDSLLTSTAISGLFPASTLPFGGLPPSASDQGNANSLDFSDLLPSSSSVVSFPESLPPSGSSPVEVTLPGETDGFAPLDTFPAVIALPMPGEFDVADAGMLDPNLPVF